MCFQAFVYYRCGHNSILEAECNFAKEMEATLWLKMLCPDYRHYSQQPDWACGKGKYYCAATAEGKHLDVVYALLETYQAQKPEIARRFHDDYKPMADRVKQRIADRVTTPGDDPEIAHVRAMQTRLQNAYFAVTRRMRLAEECIRNTAMEYRRAGRFGINPGETGAEIRRLLSQFEAAVLSADQHALPIQSNKNAYPRILQQLSQTVPALQQSGRPSHNASKEHIPAYSQPGAPSADTIARMKALVEQYNAEHASPRSYRKKSGRSPKRKPKDDPDDFAESREDTAVRRSSRISRKKVKVNYAEDEDSDIISRPSSPVKSDCSAFSPPKSDLSDTYNELPKRERKVSVAATSENPNWDNRNNKDNNDNTENSSQSLEAKIKEWRARNGIAEPQTPLQALPTTQAERTNYHTTQQQHQLFPRLPPSSHLRDQAISLPSDSNMAKANAVNPDGAITSQPFASPTRPPPTINSPAKRNWIVNKYDFDPATPPSVNRREDSPVLWHGPPFYDYAEMRRSFGSVPDMPVTPEQPTVQQSPDTDPQKRLLSGSSPVLPVAKRIRLSLPGEGYSPPPDENDIYTQALSNSRHVSSPANMMFQNTIPDWTNSTAAQMPGLPFGDDDGSNLADGAAAPEYPAEASPATPAPYMAPTAIMWSSSPAHFVAGGNASPITSEAETEIVVPDARLPIFDEKTTLMAPPATATNDDDLFSDIDWSMINQDTDDDPAALAAA